MYKAYIDISTFVVQISDTVYPMYKAYIEPDLKTAHLKIYNTFNPFSGFMDPTYILKSAQRVSKETIHSLLKVYVHSRCCKPPVLQVCSLSICHQCTSLLDCLADTKQARAHCTKKSHRSDARTAGVCAVCTTLCAASTTLRAVSTTLRAVCTTLYAMSTAFCTAFMTCSPYLSDQVQPQAAAALTSHNKCLYS